MKIVPSQIDKKYNINVNLNLNKFVKEYHYIDNISECLVIGLFEYVNEELVANLDVKTKLTLNDSKTLEPIDYELKFSLELIFGNSENSDYALEEEIAFDEIIYGHILVYKPAVLYTEEPNEEVEVKKVNPAFSELKDW